MNLYEQALIFAIKAHGDQKRKYTGEPYVVHPIRVAAMMRDSGVPFGAMCAAILHDVLEDTDTTLAQLEREFGSYIARLVNEISDVSKPEDGSRAARKALDLEHLSKASPDAQTIKVCDIIDNAGSVRAHDPEFAKIYLPEKRAQLDVLNDANVALLKQAQQIVSIAAAPAPPEK